MPKRNIFDISHNAFTCGNIGRLKTFTRIPVTAGDSVSITYGSIMRLTRLAKWMVMDAIADIFFFFVPHRHCYDNWEDFIKEGRQTDETLSTLVTNTLDSSWDVDLNIYAFHGGKDQNETIPAHIPIGYNKIWNEYFRNAANSDEIPEDYVPKYGGGTNYFGLGTNRYYERLYGYPTCRLPKLWNTGVDATRADNSSDTSIDIGSGELDLLDIRDQQSIYKDAQDLDWFASRYRDVLDHKWGSGIVPVDADERPTLLWHNRSLLSGRDINGTTADTLGTYNGVSVGNIEFSMPSKYFKEHGTIWGMHLVRFPSILADECHYLDRVSMNWANTALDPEYCMAQPPIDIKKNEIMDSSATISTGLHPYAQWMRFHPDYVDEQFSSMTGFPFLEEDDLGDMLALTYETVGWEPGDSLDNFFIGSSDQGHYNVSAGLSVEKRTTIPEATTSIYAGASLR